MPWHPFSLGPPRAPGTSAGMEGWTLDVRASQRSRRGRHYRCGHRERSWGTRILVDRDCIFFDFELSRRILSFYFLFDCYRAVVCCCLGVL